MPREYVPFDAYGLLRRIVGRGPQRVRRELVFEDAPARYLISRKLAREVGNAGERIEDTEAGRRIGLIEFEPQPQET